MTINTQGGGYIVAYLSERGLPYWCQHGEEPAVLNLYSMSLAGSSSLMVLGMVVVADEEEVVVSVAVTGRYFAYQSNMSLWASSALATISGSFSS